MAQQHTTTTAASMAKGSDFGTLAQLSSKIQHAEEAGIRFTLAVDECSWDDCRRNEDDYITGPVSGWFDSRIRSFVEWYDGLDDDNKQLICRKYSLDSNDLPLSVKVEYLVKPDKNDIFRSEGRMQFIVGLDNEDCNPACLYYFSIENGSEISVVLSCGYHSSPISIVGHLISEDQQDEVPMISLTWKNPKSSVHGVLALLCNYSDQCEFRGDAVSKRLRALSFDMTDVDPSELPSPLTFLTLASDPQWAARISFNDEITYQIVGKRTSEGFILSNKLRIKFPQGLIKGADDKLHPTAIIRNLVVAVKLPTGGQQSHRNVRTYITGLPSSCCKWCLDACNANGACLEHGCVAHDVCFYCFDYKRQDDDWISGLHLQKTCPIIAPLYAKGYTVAELKGESLLQTSSGSLIESALSTQVVDGAKKFLAARAQAPPSGKGKGKGKGNRYGRGLGRGRGGGGHHGRGGGGGGYKRPPPSPAHGSPAPGQRTYSPPGPPT